MICIVGESRAEELLGEYEIVKVYSAEINSSSAAVIVGENAKIKIRSALGVIVSDEFSGSVPRGIQLITCGISPKNTVSITSRTDEKITLSLNRSIRTSSGICEPLEFPVSVPEILSEYDIMSAFAARLLVG